MSGVAQVLQLIGKGDYQQGGEAHLGDQHREEEPLDSRAVCLIDGRIYAYCPEKFLTCLSAEDGKPVWKNSDADLLECAACVLQRILTHARTWPDAAVRLKLVHSLSKAVGVEGMVGGQALDIAGENSSYPFEHLQTIHRSKTGALIRCALQTGALAGGASSEQMQQLTSYGEAIGLAFQIVDDLLDATSTTEVLGKSAGSDQIRGKATYPAFFGIEKTRNLARNAVEQATQALAGFDAPAAPLVQLAEYIYARTY